MILGVYWYYGFPSGLYNFDYFVFRKGVGGHGDGPAQLETSIIAEDADKLINQLDVLVKKHKQAFLFVTRDNNLLTISINNYNLFDYDFLIAKEVETILHNEQVRFNSSHKLNNPKWLRLENNLPQFVYPSKDFFQIVSSHLGQYNAEALSLRLDCNLNSVHKQKFTESLDSLTSRFNIEILYYYENIFLNKTNLMLFFSNGRQGLHLNEKTIVDVQLLEQNIAELFDQFSVQKGHLGGFEAYPDGEPIVRKALHW